VFSVLLIRIRAIWIDINSNQNNKLINYTFSRKFQYRTGTVQNPENYDPFATDEKDKLLLPGNAVPTVKVKNNSDVLICAKHWIGSECGSTSF
jgi:hypothetical protein